MKNTIKYLYQLITIYVGLLIPDIIYYFFLIYVFKEKLDKNWDFSVVLSISMLFSLVMLILIFISFNLITNNKKFTNYKFNYWLILANCITSRTLFIFLGLSFGESINEFMRQFERVLHPLTIQFIFLLALYHVIFFILIGIIKWHGIVKKK